MALRALLLSLFVLHVVCYIKKLPLTGGAEEGEYHLSLHAGPMERAFTVKVDTGSAALFLPGCKNASTRSNVTNPCVVSKPCNSSSCYYKEVFTNPIQEVVTGIITTTDIDAFDIQMPNISLVAYGIRPLSWNESSADGLLGLSPWATKYSGLNLFHQMAPYVKSLDFSLCLGEFGGQLILGGYDENYIGDPIIQWVPMVSNANFTVELTDFKIAGHSVWDSLWNITALNKNPCQNCTYASIDSGHQNLVLPEGAYLAVKSLFRQQLCTNRDGPVGMCADENFFTGKCVILDDSTINEKYPTIELVFNDVSLKIPPSNYFVDFKGSSCLALQSGVGDNVIIGNRIMQQYYTIFETSNERIGFATAVNCSGAQYNVSGVSGLSQYGTLGKKLKKPLVVRVYQLNDSKPKEGIEVTFNIVETTPASEVMWIAHSIWMGLPARVEPKVAKTDANGIAMTYLWLAGVSDINTVTADVPLCLNHVVFTGVGTQSYVWRMLTYMFLFALATGVVILNVWYKKTVRKRKLRRIDSMSNLPSPSVDDIVDPIGNTPLSPSLSPPPGSLRPHSRINEYNDSEVEESFEEDDDPFQAAQLAWYQKLRRKWNWQVFHISKYMRNVWYKSK